MCKRRKPLKGLRKNLGYFATLSFIRLPIVAVAGIFQCSEHAHAHTHIHTGKNSLIKYIGEMLQNLPGLRMACGRSLLTWFNLAFPSLFDLGLHLGKCCSRQHLDITPDFSSGISTSLWQLPASLEPSFPLPLYFRDAFPGQFPHYLISFLCPESPVSSP